jgi:hypothetical protein
MTKGVGQVQEEELVGLAPCKITDTTIDKATKIYMVIIKGVHIKMVIRNRAYTQNNFNYS